MNYFEEGIECTLAKLADNTKMAGIADTLEDRIQIMYLDKLEKWYEINQNSVRKSTKSCTWMEQPNAQIQIG